MLLAFNSHVALHTDRQSGERSESGRGSTRMLAALCAALFAGAWLAAPVAAQDKPQTNTYTPQSGQAGKDVVWVPTPQALVDRMLDMAKVTPQDYLIDLGSGDGRTVITAAQRGLKAHGIEYNPDMVELAKQEAAKAGVTDRATFEKADLFESDFSKAQVITLFLLPSINEKLRPQILDLAPGTRIVSNTFEMGDWEPDETSTVGGDCTSYCKALLWIVPAKVEGTWKVGDQQLTLTQKYQKLTGTLGSAPISDAKVNGNQITFKANGAEYTGTVNGTGISGTIAGGPGGNWSATKG